MDYIILLYHYQPWLCISTCVNIKWPTICSSFY